MSESDLRPIFVQEVITHCPARFWDIFNKCSVKAYKSFHKRGIRLVALGNEEMMRIFQQECLDYLHSHYI